jgi:hypothetical protein
VAKDIKKLADALGAKVVGKLPEYGGGAFGAARLPLLVAALKERLAPSAGKRPGRPTDPEWTVHRKVPMTEATLAKLRQMAEEASTPERRVSPMQVAAHVLEEALANPI